MGDKCVPTNFVQELCDLTLATNVLHFRKERTTYSQAQAKPVQIRHLIPAHVEKMVGIQDRMQG
jgi:hypothetical protein